MNSVTLNIGSADAEKIAACIKSIAGGVSANDIVEIVLKTPAPTKEEKKIMPSSPFSVILTADATALRHAYG